MSLKADAISAVLVEVDAVVFLGSGSVLSHPVEKCDLVACHRYVTRPPFALVILINDFCKVVTSI